ncbi:MAG: SusC/RagA family TonB-linked outer membrane protein [Candidatus Symbiothrix sp.]|nr:SusC/RagA family TonB-linked outer membrane protein [Candidatus Symbiothrix sp.]
MKQSLNTILLTVVLLCCGQHLAAQQASGEIITGKVFSKADGELIGASVREVDATNRTISGAVTDINGNFTMRIKNAKNKLLVTYFGYADKSIPIGNQKNFSIEMKENESVLNEVIVTAQKRTNTGAMNIPEREVSMAMQTLKANFEEISVASLDEALQGQIAGLDIIANSGDVGAGSAMRLRGTSSINANVTPLIVVNDLIYNVENADNFDFVNANNESFANLLSINVDDIESITVLKDGASTAIYGSKGANGVISIRTKKGQRGKPRLKYSYKLSGDWQPEGYKMLNGDEYTMFLKEAYFNPRQSDEAANIRELNYITNDAVFPDWRMYDNNTDWIDAVKTTGITHDHYLTLSGGGDKATFYISAGYFNKKGSIIGQNLDRYTSRMDLDYYVSDRIRFTSEMSVTYTNEDKNYEGLLNIAYKKMPNLAIYKEDANGNPTSEYYAIPQDMSSALSDQKDMRNPVAVAWLAKNNAKSFRLAPTFRLQYDLLPYDERQMLRLKGIVSFNINNNSSYAFLPKELTTATWTDGAINKSDYGSTKGYSNTTQFDITYVPRINNRKHSLNLYVMAKIYGSQSASQSENSFGLPSGITSPTTGTYVSGMSSGAGYGRDLTFVGAAHYSYMSKYNLDFSINREGSSKFGLKRKFGTFGGLSVRYNIIDEAFMESLQEWMSMLSIRLSAGLNGNEPGSEYLHFSRYESWSSYLGSSTLRPVSIRLNDLRWEKVEDKNVGMDLGLFEDRLSASFNYYDKKTSDLLQANVSIPASSGYTVYEWQNVGSVRNQGWELNINLNRFVRAGKFYADFSMNFSNNKNTVLELSDIVLSKYNGTYGYGNGEYMSRLQLGNSIGSIYGFRYLGVYQYSADNPALIESGYTLGTAPIARNAAGEIIYDSQGKPVPMYFAFGTSNQLAFQGGDAIYEDVNSDGNINELDIVYLGNSNPKFNGGMGFKLAYDKLSISLYNVFRYGNKIINAGRMDSENMYTNNNQNQSVKWRWRKEGDVTDIPRALRGAGRNFLGSDRYVEDGSFWRVRQLSINYALPSAFLKRFSISSASVYLTVYNLFCFSNYSGVDPEVGYGSWGISKDSNQTPRAKSFTAGLSVNF